jgi:hypothetical protein
MANAQSPIGAKIMLLGHRLCLPLLTAALIAVAGSASAQAPPRDPGAQQNVKQSEQYERALCGNKAFREKRIKQECGPITDQQLHESCVASFGCGDTGPQRRRSNRAPPSETIR